MSKRKVYIGDIKAINEIERSLVCTISTGCVDRMGESLDPKGVNLKDYQKNPVVLWAHDYSTPPIGKAVWVKKDNATGGIISKVQFADTDFAKEIFKLYQGGFMKAFSVGFLPKEIYRNYQQENYNKTKDPYITFTKWDLLEYSAVPVPANPEALALAMSKGVISGDTKKKIEEMGIKGVTELNIDIDVNNEEQITEFDHEDKEAADIEESKQVAEKNTDTGLEELLAENKLLKEQIIQLEADNCYLRYEQYKFLESNKKTVSGISANDVLDKVKDIVSGEIRKAQGKADQY